MAVRASSFGSIVRTARRAGGIGPGVLAADVGCTRVDVLAWESGDAPPPSIGDLEAVEARLGLPHDLLLYALRYSIVYTPENPIRVDPAHLKALCEDVRVVLDLVGGDGLSIVETSLDRPRAVNVWLDRPPVALPVNLPPVVTFELVDAVGAWHSEFVCRAHDQLVACNRPRQVAGS